jgi:hypothetical protein
MAIDRRIARLEDRLLVGTNRDGSCRYCTGRERELGRVVVFDQYQEGPVFPKKNNDPTPTPCPQCGHDLNTRIVVHRVSIEDWAGGRRR